MKYPIQRTPAEPHSFVCTFRDVPEAITQIDQDHDSEADADNVELDCLLTAFSFYVEKHEPIPLPSAPLKGEVMLTIPLLTQFQIVFYNTLVGRGTSWDELFDRMEELTGRLYLRAQTRDQLSNFLEVARHEEWGDLAEVAAEALGLELVMSFVPKTKVTP